MSCPNCGNDPGPLTSGSGMNTCDACGYTFYGASAPLAPRSDVRPDLRPRPGLDVPLEPADAVEADDGGGDEAGAELPEETVPQKDTDTAVS